MRIALALASTVLAVTAAVPARAAAPAGSASVAVPIAPAPRWREVPAPGHGPLDPLARLGAQRLLVADEAAASQRLTGRPFADPALSDADRAAPGPAARFLRDQADAAALVQRVLLARWTAARAAAPAQAPPPGRIAVLLSGLDGRLAAAWDDAAAPRAAAGCAADLAGEIGSVAAELHLDDLHRAALARASASVCG